MDFFDYLLDTTPEWVIPGPFEDTQCMGTEDHYGNVISEGDSVYMHNASGPESLGVGKVISIVVDDRCCEALVRIPRSGTHWHSIGSLIKI